MPTASSQNYAMDVVKHSNHTNLCSGTYSLQLITLGPNRRKLSDIPTFCGQFHGSLISEDQVPQPHDSLYCLSS